MVFSTVLILLAGKNLIDPVNILSASILASSMVNAQPGRLYSAFYCSMIFSFAKYILDSPAQQKYSLLLTSALPGLKPILSTLQSQNLIHQEYFQFINIENENLNNYIDILLYYLAFHIVVTQIINDIFLRRRRKPLYLQYKNKLFSLNGPIFASIVKNFEIYEPNVTNYNSQAVTTTDDTNSNNSRANEEPVTWKNQFYQLNVDIPISTGENNDILSNVNETTNLKNFIRYLFQWKKNYLLSPLWSLVITLRAIYFEKKYLKEITTSRGGNVLNNNSESISPINSNVSNEESPTFQKKSLFYSPQDVDKMALIAQTASDDYAQLNLISSKENIFNRGENDYKVCIVDIGSHSITFHIGNLHEGQLIVFVNGVMWSEVSCALIMEREGEEYVVVNGLVPSCSYDIQFINRLEQTDDYLISDVVVRSAGIQSQSTNENISSNVSDELNENLNLQNIDFTFPSYYHRKFLSPLLTLKHSVLTTNTNLAEERIKLKKVKKEVTKKLSTLRQEIDNWKSKLDQNASNDEKSTSKIESLKLTIKQNETMSAKLENELKERTELQLQTENKYLKLKDDVLKKNLEDSKLEDFLKETLEEEEKKHVKFLAEFNHLISKSEKLESKYDILQKEVLQTSEESEFLKIQFLNIRESERSRRTKQYAQNANEYELIIKGLEQDISRIEGENSNMYLMISGF